MANLTHNLSPFIRSELVRLVCLQARARCRVWHLTRQGATLDDGGCLQYWCARHNEYTWRLHAIRYEARRYASA